MKANERTKIRIDETWARAHIETAFKTKRDRNKSYSMRAFAQYLGIGPSALSEFLSGKRRFSERKLRLILIQTGASENLISEHSGPDTSPIKRATLARKAIETSHYEILSSWIHLAVFTFLTTINEDPSPGAAAAYFGVPLETIKKSIETLSQSGLLKKVGREKYAATSTDLTTSDGVSDRHIRKAHADGLRLALRSLLRNDVTKRDFTSNIFAIDPKNFDQVKKIIRATHRQISRFEQSTSKSEVYRLNIQFHPLRGLK